MKKEQIRFRETVIGMILEDWEVEKIEHLYEISSGLSKPRNEFGFGYPFLSFKDIFDNFSLPKELHELVNSSEKERKTCSIMRGDVFLTRTSETIEELGMSSVALKDYENATFNGFAKRLRPKMKDKLLPEFAVYLFRSNKIRSQILAFSSLTTRASLNASMIKEINLFIPSLPEQTSIANILSSLDSKIGLNHQMNRTLEKFGQTIFKHWFVDFEFPNEKGKPYRSSGGEMVDSELGEIPKGWGVVSFGDIVEVRGGSTPKTEISKYWGGNIPWITPKDLTTSDRIHFSQTERYLTEEGLRSISRGLLPIGSVLLTSRAPIGYIAINDIPIVTNQGFINIICTDKVNNLFLLYWLKFNMELLLSYANGTTFLELSKGSFKKIKMALPSERELDLFKSIISPMDLEITSNHDENDRLSSIRDLLLPSLMSGRIRVGMAV